MKWKRWEIALGIALSVGILCAVPLQAQQQLAEKITRLHVLANSDAEYDQQLKLKVRDAVLQIAAVENKPDEHILAEIKLAAERVVAQEGYDYDVTVSRSAYYFDTREYETFSLPAGVYDSVRVVIGAGEGKNWWCVVYPQLCAGMCEEELKEIAQEAGLSKKEIFLICEEKGYIIRFKLADFWGKILHQIAAF